MQREKITDLVTFPVHDLDLTSYVKGPIHAEAPPIYDLYAVSEHSGGLGGGHYTAKCCNFIDNCWYDFNDSSVTPTTAEKSVSPQAYVLFYKRKKGSLRWGGLSILSLPPSSSPSEEIMMGVEEEQLSEHPSPNHMEF